MERPRILAVYQVPDWLAPQLGALDQNAVMQFVRAWLDETPADDWDTWAMFLAADSSGRLSRVPVRRPSVPRSSLPPT